MNVVAVIPARYGSTRFPGKPLAPIAGVPMVERVCRRTAECPDIGDVLVATDDERIADVVTAFGGRAVMTRTDHQTGTDRIAEAVSAAAPDADLVINVQGDEPLIPPAVLADLIAAMGDEVCDMGTVAVPFGRTGRDQNDSNAVKVVVGGDGCALYFSRSLIPFGREGGRRVEPLLHWGVYAYRRTFLERFVTWPRGTLEACEMLEQLRALENGARIRVIVTNHVSMGVDVPEDVKRIEQILRRRNEV